MDFCTAPNSKVMRTRPAVDINSKVLQKNF